MYSNIKQRLQPASIGSRCISWTLQTSLDKAVHLSTLKHLMETEDLIGLDPAIAMDCFNVLAVCIKTNGRQAVLLQGLEELATLSASCLFRISHHYLTMDPTSSVLDDVQRRYHRAFPPMIDFMGLPFRYTMIMTRNFINKDPDYGWRWEAGRDTSALERSLLVQQIREVARYQQTHGGKLPNWAIRSMGYCLSSDPPPSGDVIVNCLEIVGIELGFDSLNVGLNEKSVCSTFAMGVRIFNR